MSARLFGLLLAVAGIGALILLGNIDNVVHWRPLAAGVVACIGVAYGAICAMTGRFGP